MSQANKKRLKHALYNKEPQRSKPSVNSPNGMKTTVPVTVTSMQSDSQTLMEVMFKEALDKKNDTNKQSGNVVGEISKSTERPVAYNNHKNNHRHNGGHHRMSQVDKFRARADKAAAQKFMESIPEKPTNVHARQMMDIVMSLDVIAAEQEAMNPREKTNNPLRKRGYVLNQAENTYLYGLHKQIEKGYFTLKDFKLTPSEREVTQLNITDLERRGYLSLQGVDQDGSNMYQVVAAFTKNESELQRLIGEMTSKMAIAEKREGASFSGIVEIAQKSVSPVTNVDIPQAVVIEHTEIRQPESVAFTEALEPQIPEAILVDTKVVKEELPVTGNEKPPELGKLKTLTSKDIKFFTPEDNVIKITSFKMKPKDSKVLTHQEQSLGDHLKNGGSASFAYKLPEFTEPDSAPLSVEPQALTVAEQIFADHANERTKIVTYLNANQAVPLAFLQDGKNDYVEVSRYTGAVLIQKGPYVVEEGENIDMTTLIFNHANAKVHFEMLNDATPEKAVKVTIDEPVSLSNDPLYDNLYDVLMAEKTEQPSQPVEALSVFEQEHQKLLNALQATQEQAALFKVLMPLVAGLK